MKVFKVHMLCPEMSEVLQKLAFKKGYSWGGYPDDKTVRYTNVDWLVFWSEDKHITWGDVVVTYRKGETATVEQLLFEEAVLKLDPKQISIQIDNNEAVIEPKNRKVYYKDFVLTFDEINILYQEVEDLI